MLKTTRCSAPYTAAAFDAFLQELDEHTLAEQDSHSAGASVETRDRKVQESVKAQRPAPYTAAAFDSFLQELDEHTLADQNSHLSESSVDTRGGKVQDSDEYSDAAETTPSETGAKLVVKARSAKARVGTAAQRKACVEQKNEVYELLRSLENQEVSIRMRRGFTIPDTVSIVEDLTRIAAAVGGKLADWKSTEARTGKPSHLGFIIEGRFLASSARPKASKLWYIVDQSSTRSEFLADKKLRSLPEGRHASTYTHRRDKKSSCRRELEGSPLAPLVMRKSAAINGINALESRGVKTMKDGVFYLDTNERTVQALEDIWWQAETMAATATEADWMATPEGIERILLVSAGPIYTTQNTATELSWREISQEELAAIKETKTLGGFWVKPVKESVS